MAPNYHGFTILISVHQLSSRGTIRLQSGNPFKYPVIDPNYLSDENDVKHLISGMH